MSTVNDPSGRTILVIDDDPLIIEWFTRTLAREDVEVRFARTGEEGLSLAAECSPMAIFLDVVLPDIDGWEVLQRLKANPDLAGIPVILSTMVDERRKGQELGAVDYLLKPVDRSHMKQLIQHFSPRDHDGGVLVVEDDPVNREMLARLLRRQGKEVIEVADANSALEQMHKALPELVILDLMLPGINGLTLLKEIRQVKAFAGVPIVVLTGKDLTEEDRRSLKGAVRKVIQKGEFNREALLRELTV